MSTHSITSNQKEGIDYKLIRPLLKSFDMIAFRGSEIVSDTISEVESFERGKGKGKYTHVGLIILGNLFPQTSNLYNPNAIYIFEATMSGNLNGGVLNVNGQTFLGTQLRDFDKVVESVSNNKKAYMAWCKLKHDHCPSITPDQWMNIFNKYDGARFDVNCIDLLASAIKCFRFLRKLCCCKHKKPWMFCSELVTNIYQDLNIISNDIDARNVIPCDFVYHTNNIPAILEDPILLVNIE